MFDLLANGRHQERISKIAENEIKKISFGAQKMDETDEKGSINSKLDEI